MDVEASSSDLLREVNAPPASACWRCRGEKVVTKKVPAIEPTASGKVNMLIDVACPICKGIGTLSRKRARQGDTPKKTFPSWTDAGPAPGGLSSTAYADVDEELCSLTGRWGIFQGKSTHRYSTDDVVTAWVAWRVGLYLGLGRPEHELRIADIGTGIGSVLQMMAWLHPTARLVGLEAQATRAAAARRSCAYNGIGNRCQVVVGDLRDPAALAAGGWDIVTGTPPYFDVQAGGLPPHEEAARCLFEYRGGVEAYCEAGARLLAPHGILVLAGSALGLQRGYDGAAAAGLRVLSRVDVVPREGKAPLLVVYVLCKRGAPYVSQQQEGEGVGERGEGAAAVSLSPAAFSPLATADLPYHDMRRPEYSAWLNKEGEGVGCGAGAGEVDGPTARPVRPRQQPRGLHVQYAGLPYSAGPEGTGAGQEVVHTIRVRAAADAKGDCARTPEYRRLLWELGKPG